MASIKSGLVNSVSLRDRSEGESKSEQTRLRILDAAAHVLSVRGYARTRLTEIADIAGLQAPAIYYYFPSRDALVGEVMHLGISLTREHVADMLAALPATASATERIGAAVESHMRLVLDLSVYATASIRNAGQVPDDIRARREVEEKLYGELWNQLLKDAREEGSLRPELDLRASRMLVLGAMNWAAEWWNPKLGSLDSVVMTARALVLHGLSCEGDEESNDG
ncbi:TetR/AcrR family transcriptional regulator [Gordonia sp. KTR9]|uniref:TetR/AcrR family transcriptional regulator n=1 Tax=Gordonia sp. KTR9 TaxID=337191 RepID=UPI000677729F|nr:TetR/AcrR family transcriptional regulator [Gordonia sp. KTR9]